MSRDPNMDKLIESIMNDYFSLLIKDNSEIMAASSKTKSYPYASSGGVTLYRFNKDELKRLQKVIVEGGGTEMHKLSFGDKSYSKTLRKRVSEDRVEVLFAGLERFHKKYMEGDFYFVKAMETLNLTLSYKAFVPTEVLISEVISKLKILFPKTSEFIEMHYKDLRIFETLFGWEFINEFDIEELIELGL